MARLEFDKTGERFYETGVEHGVLFPHTGSTVGTGVAWNGLTNVTEQPSGGEATPIYADNMEYANIIGTEKFGLKIDAFMYPKEFNPCNGVKEVAKGVYAGQQNREKFDFYYETKIGSDSDGLEAGVKYHFVWNATAAPSEKANNTINDSPEAATMSWTCKTEPIKVSELDKPVAHLEIDSRYTDSSKLKTLIDQVLGAESSEPKMPTPSEVIAAIGPAVAAASAKEQPAPVQQKNVK